MRRTELIFIKEEEEKQCDFFCTMIRNPSDHEACLKQCESVHQKLIEIENKYRIFECEQHETMGKKITELETKPRALNIKFVVIALTDLSMKKMKFL